MKIICVGDSNTLGYDPRSFLGDQYPASCRWTSLLAEKLGAQVVNEGENGRTVNDLAHVNIEKCDLLILMLGTNDILEGRSAREIRNKLGEVLTIFPPEAKNTCLLVPPALKPGAWVSDPRQITHSRNLAQEYSELAEQMGYYFVNTVPWDIDFCYDGVHFTESGHVRFGTLLSEEIRTILCQLLVDFCIIYNLRYNL